MFDSALLDYLRRFELSRPVWVEAESRKIGNIQLLAALIDAMRKTVHLQLSVPIDERVRLLREDYAHLADKPTAVVERMLPLKSRVGGEELALWQSLTENGQVDELCIAVSLRSQLPTIEAALARRVRDDHRAAGDGSAESGQRRRGLDVTVR